MTRDRCGAARNVDVIVWCRNSCVIPSAPMMRAKTVACPTPPNRLRSPTSVVSGGSWLAASPVRGAKAVASTWIATKTRTPTSRPIHIFVLTILRNSARTSAGRGPADVEAGVTVSALMTLLRR